MWPDSCPVIPYSHIYSNVILLFISNLIQIFSTCLNFTELVSFFIVWDLRFSRRRIRCTVLTPYNFAVRFQRFKEIYCFHLQGSTEIAGTDLRHYSVPKPKTLQPWRRREHVSPNLWHLPAKLNGSKTQNISALRTETSCLSETLASTCKLKRRQNPKHFSPEDGESMSLRNLGIYLRN